MVFKGFNMKKNTAGSVVLFGLISMLIILGIQWLWIKNTLEIDNNFKELLCVGHNRVFQKVI